ncbi:hypothetical protein BH11PLA2_BH11PLA2_38220 [soil metagenome]
MDIQEPKGVELHIRRFPRSTWLRLRQAALAEDKGFRLFIVELLERAAQKHRGCEPEVLPTLKNESQTTTIAEPIQ